MKSLILTLCLIAPLSSFAHQASVSFDCTTNRITEVNVEGVTFFPNMLAAQGFAARADGNLMHFDHGGQSLVVGSLQKPAACLYTPAVYTRFVDFTNANLQISSKADHLTACFPVTTDGVYGITLSVTISMIDNGSGASMQLKEVYTQDYSSLDECKANESNHYGI
jgi:hypothetical protein